MAETALQPIPKTKNRLAETQFQDLQLDSQKIELTTQETAENFLHETVSQMVPVGDPYPNKTPHHMLSRQYLISEFSFSDTTVTSIRPFALLMANPTVQQYLARFRLFRAGVRLKVMLVTNQMQYGMVGISYVPYTESDTLWKTLAQRSQANMALLDLSEQEGYELQLPYLSPILYVDAQDPLTWNATWRVDIGAICLGTVTNATSNFVYCKIFASFVDPECAGYQGEEVVLQSAVMNRPFSHNLGMVAGAVSGGLANIMDIGMNWATNLTPAAAATTVTAGASAAALYNTVNMASKLSSIVPRTKETESIPTRTIMCPDLSSPGGSTVVSELGDPSAKIFSFLPQQANIGDIVEACMVPTYMRTDTLADTTTVTIPCDAQNWGYTKYFRKMYKYRRGSTRILLRFSTSPLVSGRVRITLYPLGGPAITNPEGDLPSWIITIKGPTSWCAEIPYLQLTPWVESDSSTYTPSLRVELLDDLLQPFDKAVSIFMNTFVSAGADWQFAGLQSIVASEVELQCSVAGEMTNCLKLGSTYPFPYQGNVTDLGTILTRYSSRDPDPELRFPFPVKINAAADLTKLDNFDYVANVFKFYTGDTNVRLLFSSGAADGLLRCEVGNSNTAVGGSTWKAGNSMAMTDQRVWPMLEFRYPYLNTIEFDSIWEPNGMFPQKLDATATLSAMFISASQNFRLMYLLPVPDFSLASSEVEFQSYGPARLNGRTLYGGTTTLTATTGSTTTLTSLFNWYPSMAWYLEGFVTRTSGAVNFNGMAALRNNGNAIATLADVPANSTLIAPFQWVDQANSGVYSRRFKIKGTTSGDATVSTTLNLGFYLDTSAVDVQILWTLTIAPWHSTSLPIGTGPFSVSGTEIVNTVSTAEQNIVSVQNGTASLAVEIVGTDPVPISGEVRVQGVVAPTDPVWTTLYQPS